MAGSGFEVFFGWWPEPLNAAYSAWWERCRGGCLPGTLVDFGDGGLYRVSDRFVVPGSAAIANVVYDGVFFDGQLNFGGPAVVLPDAGEDYAGFSATGPFTFEGRLSAYADETRSGTPVFTLNLVGSGTATAVFFSYQGRFHLADEDLVYRFGP